MSKSVTTQVVIPAQAGIKYLKATRQVWIPACAGMTFWCCDDDRPEQLRENSLSNRAALALLVLILLLAAWLRLPGLSWGLPNELHGWPYNSDESYVFKQFEQMDLRNWDLRVTDSNWGALYVYLGGVVLKGGDFLGTLTLSQNRDFYTDHPVELARLYLALRLLTLTTSLLGIVALYALGACLFDRPTGLLAAAFMAVSPLSVIYSTVATPHFTQLLFAMLALLAFWRASVLGSGRLTILSGFLLGLTGAMLYDAAVLVVPMLIVHVLHRPDRARNGWGIGACLVAVATFILVNPHLIFPARPSARSAVYVLDYLMTVVFRPSLFASAMTYAFSAPVALASLMSFIGLVSMKGRDKRVAFLGAWGAVYLFFILLNGPLYMRRLIPLIPPLCIGLGYALVRMPRRLAWLLGLLLLGSGLVATLAYRDVYRHPDLRTEVRLWVDATIPAGARIGVWDWHLGPHLDVRRNPVALLTRGEPDERLDYFIGTEHELPLAGAMARWPTARLLQRFEREPAIGPLRYSLKGAPEDWLYPIPAVYVLEL